MSADRSLQVKQIAEQLVSKINSYNFYNQELKDKANSLDRLLKNNSAKSQVEKETEELMAMLEKIELTSEQPIGKQQVQHDMGVKDKNPVTPKIENTVSSNTGDPILDDAIQRCKILINKYQHEKENAKLAQEILDLRFYMLHKNLDAELLNNKANLIEGIAKSLSLISIKQLALNKYYKQFLKLMKKIQENPKKYLNPLCLIKVARKM
jgi:hypothetical protein